VQIPAVLLPHTIAVQRYLGIGPYGEVFGPRLRQLQLALPVVPGGSAQNPVTSISATGRLMTLALIRQPAAR
jgi:hypothetical protein